MSPSQRLAGLGLLLPLASTPAGLYRPGVQVGSLLFLSGVGPKRADGSFVTGKVGDTVSPEEGRHAARLAGVQLLAAITHDRRLAWRNCPLTSPWRSKRSSR